jgi:hypothetical protein
MPVKKIRPELPAGEADLSVITPEAWEILQQDNDPPRLFRYANVPQRSRRNRHRLDAPGTDRIDTTA